MFCMMGSRVSHPSVTSVLVRADCPDEAILTLALLYELTDARIKVRLWKNCETTIGRHQGVQHLVVAMHL